MQLSIPTSNLPAFREALYSVPFLKGTRLNIAIEAEAKSFLKLIIKVRPKIVADGLDDATFDVTKRGRHLSAREVNELLDKEDTIVVDMRNHYESEVGYFEGAIRPEVTNFREILPVVEELLEDKKDREIVMYCTGGIRCEKASAYYLHRGFERVSMVDGGIIEYARQCEREGLEKKYNRQKLRFRRAAGRAHHRGRRQQVPPVRSAHRPAAGLRKHSLPHPLHPSVRNVLGSTEIVAPRSVATSTNCRKTSASSLLLIKLSMVSASVKPCGLPSCSFPCFSHWAAERRCRLFSEQEQPLTVMSYNIRLNVESDGENAWPKRKEFLVSQILFHAPGIIGTQEVTPGQLDYLEEHLTPYAHIGVGREGGDKGEYSALFYNRHKFSVQDSGHLLAFDHPRRGSLRGLGCRATSYRYLRSVPRSGEWAGVYGLQYPLRSL